MGPSEGLKSDSPFSKASSCDWRWVWMATREEELEVGGVRDEAKVWHGHAEVHADGAHEEDERAAVKVLGHLAPAVELGNEAMRPRPIMPCRSAETATGAWKSER